MKETTKKFQLLIRKILKEEGCDKKSGKVKVYFTDAKDMRKLNRKFRGFDRTTDVLSFYMGDREDLGEIVISDHEEKKGELVLHGVLHLLGYDHKKLKERKLMRAKEEKYLKWA